MRERIEKARGRVWEVEVSVQYFIVLLLAVLCLGLDYMLKDTQCNGKKIKLQLW